jgi:hypothetical protein
MDDEAADVEDGAGLGRLPSIESGHPRSVARSVRGCPQHRAKCASFVWWCSCGIPKARSVKFLLVSKSSPLFQFECHLQLNS